MNPPRDALHITAYDRAYILPRAPRQDTPNLPPPPGRRRLSRGSQMLALAVLTRPRFGQPLLCAGAARAVWSRGRYRITGWELAPGEELRGTDLDALRSAGVHVFQDALEFSRRRLIAGGYEAGMMPAGWDLPFLLGRFARNVRFGRDTASRHMTLDLTGSPWDPRVRVTAWDGTRSRIAWTRFAKSRSREEDGHDVFPGLFFDLQRQAHMYTSERLTFAEACALFNVALPSDFPPADEITEDAVRALLEILHITVDLTSAMITEWNRIGGAAAHVPSPHPRATGFRPVFPTDVASPATLLSAVLEHAGIPKDADSGVPSEWLGRAMAAYKGGRCEAMLPGMIVPVRYVDAMSAHPVVGSLIGASEHLIAERVEIVPCTEEAQDVARTVTIDDPRDRTWWRRYGTVLCRVRCPQGAILPVQARYIENGDLTVALNQVWSERDRWAMLLDVAGNRILGGPDVEIAEAVRFVPGTSRPGLGPIPFRGTTLDPYDDLFRQLVEEVLRAKAAGESLWASFLKIIENSLYGLFAQYNEVALGRMRSAKIADVWDGNGHRTIPLFNLHTKQRIRPEEIPGPFFRPWLAAAITAGTRLLLAMQEAKVREYGGSIAAADTDCALIVASPKGGLIQCSGGPHRLPNGRRAIQALSFTQVDKILAWFRPLSSVGSNVWKLEGENTPPPGTRSSLLFLSYGPKRYTLFFDMSDGRVYIAKASAHALTIRPPRGMSKPEFLRSAWEALTRYERGDRPSIHALPYAQELAIGELPLRGASVFRRVRSCLPKSQAATLLPFGTLMVARQASGLTTWGPRMSALPVAPLSPDPLRARWIDLGLGDVVDVIATPQTDEEWAAALAADSKPRMIAGTYADVLMQHRDGTEYKYVAHNGHVATLRCGLLRRRPVFIEQVRAIGKEARLAEEAQAGIVPAWAMDTIYDTPDDPRSEERASVVRELQAFLLILKPVSRKWLAKHAHVSNSSGMLRAVLNGRKRPGIVLAKRLIEIARAIRRNYGDLARAATTLRRRAS